MAIEQTLAIIKPDAVRAHYIGKIIQQYEAGGLQLVEMKMARLTNAEAEALYAVHRDRPFYQSLVAFMASGPVVALLLQGESAILRHRELMGATDPQKAAEGTIRRAYGRSIEENAVHGSDSAETAAFEIPFFFRGDADS